MQCSCLPKSDCRICCVLPVAWPGGAQQQLACHLLYCGWTCFAATSSRLHIRIQGNVGTLLDTKCY
jgi:hypothetical protein